MTVLRKQYSKKSIIINTIHECYKTDNTGHTCFVTYNIVQQGIFTNKANVIKKMKGIIVFADNESRKDRNRGNGDVFTDSLVPDFFIQYDFPKKVITKEDIDKALFSKQAHDIYFFYFIRDCNGRERAASIEVNCTAILLDKNINNYLHSNKIYVEPTVIHFTKNNIDREYYDLHKQIILYYKDRELRCNIVNGTLEVLRAEILEFDWTKQ